MSDPVSGSANGAWLIDETVRAALPAVEARLSTALRSGDAAIDELAGWIVAGGGKRLRPTLLLLTAGDALTNEARASAIDAAAAVELVHVASLYHDDVMDRADTRRGLESVNRRWGSPSATLIGTFIFARAMRLITGLGEEAAVLAGRQCAELCRGQLGEAENAFNTRLGVDEHLSILERKTGALFVLSAGLGAIIAERAAGERASIEAYCRHLGLAFQLRDDVLDYLGTTQSLGKRAGTDFREGNYTLPALLLLARSDATAHELQALLRLRVLSEEDIQHAVALITASGTVEETAGLARAKAEEAVSAADTLPGGSLLTSLRNLARLSVERLH